MEMQRENSAEVRTILLRELPTGGHSGSIQYDQVRVHTLLDNTPINIVVHCKDVVALAQTS